jgi:hypothetical protein
MWSHQNSGKRASSRPASSGVSARRLASAKTRSGSTRRLGADTLRTDPSRRPPAGKSSTPPNRRPGPPPDPPRGRIGHQLLRRSRGRVAAAGEPHWLIQGLWPPDAYGVLAAQEKAGKIWAAIDLTVSVATGRPRLDHFACPTPARCCCC